MTAGFSLIARDGITCSLCGQFNLAGWETYDVPLRAEHRFNFGRLQRDWRTVHICAECLAIIRKTPATVGV